MKPSSRQVTALRNAGELDAAYSMALQLIERDANDKWNILAYAWTVYELAKQALRTNDFIAAKNYLKNLDRIKINEEETVLLKSIAHIQKEINPELPILRDARNVAKQLPHNSAIVILRETLQLFPDDKDLCNDFAWLLHKELERAFDTSEPDAQKISKLLAEYVDLKNTRPSILHTTFLRFAYRISNHKSFNFLIFLRLWDLNMLRDDDFYPFFIDHQKNNPSLAESVLIHAATITINTQNLFDAAYLLPFLEKNIDILTKNTTQNTQLLDCRNQILSMLENKVFF